MGASNGRGCHRIPRIECHSKGTAAKVGKDGQPVKTIQNLPGARVLGQVARYFSSSIVEKSYKNFPELVPVHFRR